ncbi:YL1 nuclear protein-domain-containing protein [Lenzites betulinus]|nr:YL1 nuclear protein-domain-containing protein [Lenzites betulinus]
MEDSLVARRPRRSTAGNRMEAALAEFKAEDVGLDADEDADFALERDEEDVFGSDFESTDEEGQQEDVDAAAEKMIRQEDSHARKANRTQLERITALAHARQAATFNPELIAPPDKEKTTKKIRRRVSLGVAVDAETGEVTSLEAGAAEDVESASAALGRRHSTRTHTVANTSATVSRVKDEERKQSSAPKRAKSKNKALTQAELISRALDMEEGNIAEHKNYLTIEEEKRRKARVVRASVQGPLLRWISKADEVTVQVDPGPPPTMNTHPTTYPHYGASQIATGAPGYSFSQVPSTYVPAQFSASPVPQAPFQQWPLPPLPPVYQSQPLPPLQPPPLPPPPQPVYRKDKVGKQYVIHELEQVEKAPRPSWSTTMTAMFGDQTDWENAKVYTTKGRPLARPVQICPITGKAARYLDPRTNIPYADLDAYRVISAILRHDIIWSPALGCYVSKEGTVFSEAG